METSAERLTRLAKIMAQELVDRPEEVLVTSVAGEYSLIIEINTHPTDVGKLIGKMGVNADAMREILTAVGCKLHISVVLEIIDPFSSRHDTVRVYRPPFHRRGT